MSKKKNKRLLTYEILKFFGKLILFWTDFIIFFMSKKSINNIIQQNGLFFILDKNNKTCSLYNTSGKNDHIIIPRSINYKDQEYIVTSITKINQDFTPKVKSIQFPSDSEVRTIKPMALAFSFLESLEIPASITEFKENWLYGTKYLTQIKVAQTIGTSCT